MQNELGTAQRELNAVREDNQRMQAHISELERALSSGNDGAQQQVVALQQQLAETEQQLVEPRASSSSRPSRPSPRRRPRRPRPAQGGQQPGERRDGDDRTPPQAVQMLALAQQTADQHLAQSKAEAERLLAEAQRNHEETIGAAQEQAQQH